MTPSDLVDEYIQIVEKEIEQYKKFRGLLIEEQNLLVSGQILNLQNNIRSQAVLLRDIRKIEEYRELKKDALSKELSIDEMPVTLRLIANALSDCRKERLLTLLEDFRYTVSDIVKINGNNHKLVEHGKSFIQEQIEGIYAALNKEEFYNPERNKNKNQMKVIRLFDRKV